VNRILLIEDNQGGLLALADALRLKLIGAEVDTARSGEEGLKLIYTYSYECILCDILLPGMDGIEFLMTVREHQPDLSVILTTAGEFVREEEALGKGAFAFLPKPLDIDLVRKTVALAMERTRLLRQVRQERIRDVRSEQSGT
jgi:DNA-binding NtrC family response regulator